MSTGARTAAGVVGWLNTKMFEETVILDNNGSCRRDEGYFGVELTGQFHQEPEHGLLRLVARLSGLGDPPRSLRMPNVSNPCRRPALPALKPPSWASR